MKRLIAAVISIALVLSALLFSLSRCGSDNNAGATNLMSGVKAGNVSVATELEGPNRAAIADFAVRLFKNCASGDENSLISPISVLYALSMTANGADGETLRQMEEVFGLTVPELNAYLYAYMSGLPSDGKATLSFANSIWFKDDPSFSAEPDFLQVNADYYGASVYKAPFDKSTLRAINAWVSQETDGMINDILDEIPPLTVMYLINALAFDAEWRDIYKEIQVRDGVFTAESGDTRSVKMMYSEERAYLDDGNATGFIKYYSGGRYAFAALLPNEGISVSEYITSLDGAGLADTLKNAQSIKVNTAIPEFVSGQALEMNDILSGMGMRDAFDLDLANFSRLGHSDIGNLYISRVIHKTYIAVDERGTKAGAAAVTEIRVSSMPPKEETKTVILDRPFVYMIIDCETYLPVFIGAALDLE